MRRLRGPGCCRCVEVMVLIIMLLLLAGPGPVDAQEGDANATNCNIAYTAAYMSMFNGDCKRDADASVPPGSCSHRCQGKIDAMRTACQGQHFIEEDDTIVPFAKRSFLVRAVNTLERLGPADCDYTAFYSRCDAHCSLAYITGGQGTSDFEAHHCLDVDPMSPQSSPEAVFHKCVPARHTRAPCPPPPGA
jgi:hypothetical protein